jgi:hypothetical protein
MKTAIRQLGAVVLAAGLLAGCTKKETGEADPGAGAQVEPPFLPPPEPARAAVTPRTDTRYTLVARASNKCLQLAGADGSDGAPAEIWECNGTELQAFTLQPVAGSYHNIVGVGSKKCLDVVAQASADSALVGQARCNGQPSQDWILADGTTGWLRIVSRQSGKVLDIADAETRDGARLNQQPWKELPHQEFQLVPVGAAAEAGGKPAGAGRETPGATGRKGKK